jgi:hypothetical protein
MSHRNEGIARWILLQLYKPVNFCEEAVTRYSRSWPSRTCPWDYISEVDLNPGITAEVMVVFVVPEGSDAGQYQAQLHGSSGSPGVAVQLLGRDWGGRDWLKGCSSFG